MHSTPLPDACSIVFNEANALMVIIKSLSIGIHSTYNWRIKLSQWEIRRGSNIKWRIVISKFISVIKLITLDWAIICRKILALIVCVRLIMTNMLTVKRSINDKFTNIVIRCWIIFKRGIQKIQVDNIMETVNWHVSALAGVWSTSSISMAEFFQLLPFSIYSIIENMQKKPVW